MEDRLRYRKDIGVLVVCPECGARFQMEDIAVSPYPTTNILFYLHCPYCNYCFDTLQGVTK